MNISFYYHVFYTLLIFLCCPALGYSQIDKKISQSIETGNAKTLCLDVPDSKILWRTTKGKRIIIEANIELSVPNEELLNFIVNSGRYHLDHTTNPQTKQLFLYSKRNRNILIVKGEECQEKVIYTIFVPSHLHSPAQ